MLSKVLLFLSTMIVSWLLTYPLVWLLNYLHVGQFIRDEGPASHHKKAGTPTMGGVGILTTIIIFCLVFIDFEVYPQFMALLLMFVAFSLLGFVDDFVKITKKHNLGLTFWQKIILQTIFASAFSISLFGFPIPMFYVLFSTFVIVGSANATNLTDGLDGLLAGCATIAFLAFSIIAAKVGNITIETICLVSTGAIVAFLYFNFPKAKVFMGDTCSLALGALLAGIAVILHKEFVLALIGLVFVVEALSVIIQVVSYKLFKKRVFKMSPLHHHFELMGWGENRVVVIFWIAAAVCALVAVIL